MRCRKILLKNIVFDFKVLRSSFCKLFLFALFLRSVGVYSLLPAIFDSIIFGFILFFGLILTLFSISIKISNIYFSKNPINFGFGNGSNFLKNDDKFLLLFWLATFASCIVNFRYALFANMRELSWCAINFFLIYSYGGAMTENSIGDFNLTDFPHNANYKVCRT
jgi:hypothetical protein